MKYIRTKDGKVYDLESKEISSWEYIDNDTAINKYGVEHSFYAIYYFDENKGYYSKYDGKGGHSCIYIEEKDILKQADTIKELVDGYYLDIDNHPFDSTQIYDKYELQKALVEKMSWQAYSDRKYLGYEINLYAFIKTEKGLIFVSCVKEEMD